MDKNQVLIRLKQFKTHTAPKLGVVKMGIFGSVARGTSTVGSDIDVVVKLNRQNLINTIGLRQSLEDFFGVPVDVVNYTENLSPLLKKRINKDVIYV
nr:nucleotidyltransferase domain-containing protein [uncultured Desulfobacter sp.]